MKKIKKENIEEPLTKEWLAPDFKEIALIGTGGTGSFLVQGICKLIVGYNLPIKLTLVDPDVVEEKNIYRQNFHSWEIGENKAKALALRMSQDYGLALEGVAIKGEEFLAHHPTNHSYYYPDNKMLTICCVDNYESRLNMQKTNYLLDVGNGLEHGQVIFGTTDDLKLCKKEVRNWKTTPYVSSLPCPVLKAGMKQLSGIETQDIGCADHHFGEQSIFVNELAAQATLVILQQLLIKHRLTTPAIYFDSGRGRMNPAKLTKSYYRI